MAVGRVAIFAGVAIVPDARIARMTLTRLDRHKPFPAVGKPLELDGGERISCQNTAEDQSKSDDSYRHVDTPMFSSKFNFLDYEAQYENVNHRHLMSVCNNGSLCNNGR
jgi:hypothetical protein